MARQEPYPTDLTDAEWKLLAALLPGPSKLGRPPRHARRAVFNAIFYVLRSGGGWRLLPAAGYEFGRSAPAALLGHRHLVRHDLALDGAARHEVHHHEGHHGDADERRDDEQYPTDEISGHRPAGADPVGWPCWSSTRAKSSQYLSSLAPASSFFDGSRSAASSAALRAGSIHQRVSASR